MQTTTRNKETTRKDAPRIAWSAAPDGSALVSREPASTEITSAGFDEVVASSIPAMLRAAVGILGSEDLAWDAVQETLLRVWTSGWLPERPTAALVHLTVKSSLHQLRCQRRRRDHEAAAERDPGSLCCEEDPLAVLEDAEGRRSVREAVKALAEDHRAVLELFAFQGESYESIARRLGVPLGTVRSRLSRGKAMLRERLVADEEEAA